MVKEFLKKILKPSSKIYKILSYGLNYSEKGYLPRRIESIEPVLENLSKSKEKVNFIQVGSNDGVSGDPLNKFIISYDWEGIVIEPIPFLFEKLKENYQHKMSNLHFLNIAISADGEVFKKFYSINEKYRGELPDWYFQLGTFYKNVLYHHEIPNIDDYIKVIEVPADTIQNILFRNKVDKLDLIHIDTEGYDFEILKTIELKKYSPNVILTEYVNLDKENRIQMLKLLRLNGYEVYRNNQDFISIHRSICKKLLANNIFYAKWD